MIERHLKSKIIHSLKHFPIVLVNGARQIGKSTLVKQIFQDGDFDQLVTLDDYSYLNLAISDPTTFVNNFKNKKVIIDEIQRAPEIILVIKQLVDKLNIKGQFLLTGSANILHDHRILDSLAGRMDIFTLEGFSQAEINQLSPSSFFDIIFSSQDLCEIVSKIENVRPILKNIDLFEMVFFGGFPRVILSKDINFRERWINAYINSYIEKDFRDFSNINNFVLLNKLYRIIISNSGSLLNYRNLAVNLGLDHRTVARYIEILEMTFQIKQLTPWFNNPKKRLVKTSKVYSYDSSIASCILGIQNVEQLPKSPQWGMLLETFIYSEIRKILSLSPHSNLYFYKTHLNKEVDFVVNFGSKYCAIECKSTSSISNIQLRKMENILKDFESDSIGIILYSGKDVIHLNKSIAAIPFKYIF